jgi:uncharacterized protein (TIGR01244 family)
MLSETSVWKAAFSTSIPTGRYYCRIRKTDKTGFQKFRGGFHERGPLAALRAGGTLGKRSRDRLFPARRGDDMQLSHVDDAITIADQPTREEIQALPAQGYVAVVNLRRDGEPDQPMSTSEEGVEAGSAGLEYLHEGVGGAPLTTEGVEAVSRFLDEQTQRGKVLVHCRRGSRAAALVLVHLARKEGWESQNAIDKGRERGLNVDGNLRIMVELYLAQQAMQG